MPTLPPTVPRSIKTPELQESFLVSSISFIFHNQWTKVIKLCILGTFQTYFLLSSPEFYCFLACLIHSNLAYHDSFLPCSLKSIIHPAAMATHPKGKSYHLPLFFNSFPLATGYTLRSPHIVYLDPHSLIPNYITLDSPHHALYCIDSKRLGLISIHGLSNALTLVLFS